MEFSKFELLTPLLIKAWRVNLSIIGLWWTYLFNYYKYLSCICISLNCIFQANLYFFLNWHNYEATKIGHNYTSATKISRKSKFLKFQVPAVISILRKNIFGYVLFTNEFKLILIPVGGNFTIKLRLTKKKYFEGLIQKLHNLVSLGLRNPPAVQRGATPLSPCGK